MEEKKLILVDNGLMELKNYIFEDSLDNDLIIAEPINVGICSSDIPRAFNNKAYFYPLVLGHEFCVRILEDKRKKLNPGQRFAVFPLMPCFKCESCKKKKYNMCKKYSYYGSRVDGGLQSKIKINRWNLIPIPNELDNISASLIEPISVCVHAVKKIKWKQKVLIFGGGFLAQIISQLLAQKECKIFCIDRNRFKKKYFQKSVFFTSDENDLLDSSFDTVIECCGAENILSKCIKYAKAEGTIIQMANPFKTTNLSSDGISSLMRKEQKIYGTWNSDYRPDDIKRCDWHETISLLKNNQISIKNLISHQIEIDNADTLFKDIYNRKSNNSNISEFNKGIIKVNF